MTTEGAGDTGRGPAVKDGHLPVSELLFDRPGAASPYGEDVTFPLPVDRLRYEHAQPQPVRER